MTDDDVPLKFIREFVELHNYFYAPNMHVLTFEMKFDALKLRADKLMQERGCGVTMRTSSLDDLTKGDM